MGEKYEIDSKVFITARSTICQQLDLSAKFASSNFVDMPVSSEFAQFVCSLIEAIFIHGLRDAFFVRGSRYSKRPVPNFWPLVSKYAHRSIKLQIYALNQIKTEVGKARAWIRIVISERTLESYINLFSKDAQISQFYKKGSFIREKACVDYLNVYLQKLDSMTIVAPLNSNLLNSWTPNPLILAGLIPGLFINCYSRIGDRLVSSPSSCAVAIDNSGLIDGSADQHSPEEATNALDLLLTPPDSMTTNLEECSTSNINHQSELLESPSACFSNKFDKQIGGYVGEYLVDDNESVISHPSMLLQFDDEPLFEKPQKLPKTFADLKRYGAVSSRLKRLSPSLIGADIGCGAEFDTAIEGDDDVFCLGKNMGLSEEQSAEVIVHRKKTGRRRAVSKSSGGAGSDTGGSVGAFSRTNSANNLIKSSNYLEVSTSQLIENKSTSSLHTTLELNSHKTENVVADIRTTNNNSSNELSSNKKIITFSGSQGSVGIEMPIPTILIQQRILQEMEFPPLGSSLHDELLLAERMEQEALKEKEERNEENDSHQISITSSNSEIIRKNSSPPILEMFNITAINNSTDSSTNDLPATFDEALRAFLAQGDKNTSRLFQSDSKKRLFSECSSSGGDLNKLLGESSTNISNQQFSPPLRSLSLQYSTTNLPFSNVFIKSSNKKNVSKDLIQSLAPIKDIPHISFQRDGNNFDEEEKDGDEIIEIQPYTELINVSSDPKNCLFSSCQNTTTSFLSSPYKLPKRLCHLIKIPVERGLDAQNFRCKTCCRNIGVSFGQFKDCALNGHYYCEDCFCSGGESLIPSRAILNADFKPKCISNSSRVLLQSIMDQPLFKVDFLNPYIYEHCKNMRKIRDIRRKLGYSVMYLLSCKNSVANDIRRRLWPHNHLHSDIHAYSLMDLECVANGTLERRLSSLLTSTLSHIWDCPLCLQKGFFCELCSSDRPIYPFQTETVCQCPNCSACFHRICSTKFGLKEVKEEDLKEKDLQQNSNEDLKECHQNSCPKCLRRAKLVSSGGGMLSSPPSSLNLSSGSSHQLLNILK